MTDPVIFAFYRDGEPKESAVMAPPVPLEVLRQPPLAGSAFDVAERFPGRAAGPVYMSLPHGMETWHAVCALTSDDDGIQAARDFFCMERL